MKTSILRGSAVRSSLQKLGAMHSGVLWNAPEFRVQSMDQADTGNFPVPTRQYPPDSTLVLIGLNCFLIVVTHKR